MRKEKLGGEEGGDRVHHPHLIKHLEKEVLQHKLTYFNFCAGIANSDVPQAACCVLRPAVVSVIFILFQKRALKAENSAAKLKQENALLQVRSSLSLRPCWAYWDLGASWHRGYKRETENS